MPRKETEIERRERILKERKAERLSKIADAKRQALEQEKSRLGLHQTAASEQHSIDSVIHTAEQSQRKAKTEPINSVSLAFKFKKNHILAMSFTTFLLTYGVFPQQKRENTLRITRTRGFKLGSLSFLREPTTKEVHLRQFHQFIIDFKLEDLETRPGLTLSKALSAAVEKRGITPEQWDNGNLGFETDAGPYPHKGSDSTGGTQPDTPSGSHQGTSETGESQQPGHPTPDPGDNSHKPFTGPEVTPPGPRPSTPTPDPQLEVRPKEDPEQVSRNKRYTKFFNQDGKPLHPSEFVHHDGTRFSEAEFKLESLILGEMFDSDRRTINPNTLDTHSSTALSRITALKPIIQRHTNDLAGYHRRMSLELHNVVEGLDDFINIRRTQRIAEASERLYHVMATEALMENR
jgi:hypothetical protein